VHKCETEQKTVPDKNMVSCPNPHLVNYLSVLSKSKHKIEQQNGISCKPEIEHDIHRSS
jgi:hypothetical protein